MLSFTTIIIAITISFSSATGIRAGAGHTECERPYLIQLVVCTVFCPSSHSIPFNSHSLFYTTVAIDKIVSLFAYRQCRYQHFIFCCTQDSTLVAVPGTGCCRLTVKQNWVDLRSVNRPVDQQTGPTIIHVWSKN